jgi:hypothetical protein
MHLEAGHARKGARRGPDLRREVRQRRKVVAERSGFLGKPVTRKLHPIAGIAGEPDYDAVEVLDLLGHSWWTSSTLRGRAPWAAAWVRERSTGW